MRVAQGLVRESWYLAGRQFLKGMDQDAHGAYPEGGKGYPVKRIESTLFLSATDLANHLACRRLTSLDLAEAVKQLERPNRYRPEAEILRQRGEQHERAYLEHLSHQGFAITHIEPSDDPATALDRTCRT